MASTKILSPIREMPIYYEDIESEMVEIWKRELYQKIYSILNQKDDGVFENSSSALAQAIKSGRITFYRGQFQGSFNASISRELRKLNAEWDKKHGSFRIPFGDLPEDIKTVITTSYDRWLREIKKINQAIDSMSPEKIANAMSFDKLFDSTIFRIDDKITKQVSFIPKLTKEQRAKISEKYTNNLELYIKDWTEKEIVKLRKMVKKSATGGVRNEFLAKEIEKRYGVSKTKAKFLARQETSLLLGQMREDRYREAGSEGYYWTCVVGSPAHPVRPMHKALDGKYIKWSNPPVTDEKGNRNHAGCDFNCRCTPRAVVKF